MATQVALQLFKNTQRTHMHKRRCVGKTSAEP